LIGFLKNLLSFRSVEKTASNLDQFDDFWYNIGGGASSSGALVNKATAMRQWAVYACVSEIAQTLAQLPLKLKRPDGHGGTEDAEDHPLYALCKISPNPTMTSFNWRESQQAHLLTHGNNYNFIERTRNGVKYIWPIDPNTVTTRFATGKETNKLRLSSADKVVYDIQTAEGKRTYPAKDVLHVVGFGFDGLRGESVITNYAKNSIGNAISIDEFQAAALKNGIFPSGVLEHPDTLGDNKEQFIAALERRFSGAANNKRPMVLENGMKWQTANVSLVDQQFIDQKKISVGEICGIYKVPPHRIGIFEKNTNYNNTEQGNKSFLDGTMQQWVVRWEQAMAWKLLTSGELREGYFFKFNFDALLRPDAKTRSEIAWKEWQTGVPLNVIRKRDDLNPIEGGDVSFVPVNMIPSNLAGKNIEAQVMAAEKKVEEPAPKEELLNADIESLRDFEKNVICREIKKQAEGKSEKDFGEFLEEFYAKLFNKIDKRTRLIIRCFNSEISTNNIIDQIKEEFNENRQKLNELQKRNWGNIESVWDE